MRKFFKKILSLHSEEARGEGKDIKQLLDQ